jgi:hypothetical protein
MLWIDEKKYLERRRLKRLMLQEARKIHLQGFVQRTSENIYYVCSKVFIVQRASQTLMCNCEVFKKLKMCPHVFAVQLMEKGSHA